MKKILTILTLSFLGHLNLVGQSILKLDQKNENSISATFEASSSIDGNTTKANGQTFIAGVTGSLTKISFYLNTTNYYPILPGTFKLTLFDGSGFSGTSLSSQTFVITGSETSGFYDVTLPNGGANVILGQTYTYMLEATTVNSRIMLDASGDKYSAGLVYNKINNFTPSSMTGYDMKFRTYVECTAKSTTSSLTACDSYLWNNTTYTTSGQYVQTLNTATGCDSIVTLNLTINKSTHNVSTQTACESYTWNGTTYTTSGTYTFLYNNANGCASVDTLKLTINKGTHNISTQTAFKSSNFF